VAPWTDLVEVHWRPGFEVYVTPVGRDEVGVAVLGPRGLDLAAAVAACPPVADRLAGVAPADAVRGAGPLRQRSTARVRGRVALVGDAAGYVDALTGEGLAVGFAAARELAAAVAAGDLPSYERAWRRTARAQRLVTEGVLRLATSPLRRAVVPIARAVPPVFGTAVDLLAGTGAA
jgi:flavin-dependent dehydrogenase